MYTLTKVDLEEGKDSLLPTGYSSSLPWLSLYDYETDEVKKIDSIQEIEQGWQVVLTSLRDYHRTSKIKEILKTEEDKIIFRTQTSVYEVTQYE